MSPDRVDAVQRDDWPVPTPEVLRLLEGAPSWGRASADERDADENEPR